jgi:PAS domain S-box-containing protein
MKYKLQDMIDLEQFQSLQDRLNEIYPFPSAIIDNEGNILTATAWQDICTQFHRKNNDCERDCLQSDQYIQSHLHEANPAVSYRCPRGLVDNATPIIIDGIHYGNYFTGQFFLEKPDLEFYKAQAKTFGFDEDAYLEAVRKVPIWSQKQLESYLLFIKGLILIISESALKKFKEIEARKQKDESEERATAILSQMNDGFMITTPQGGRVVDVNDAMCHMLGYTRDEMLEITMAEIEANDSPEVITHRIQAIIQTDSAHFESRYRRKNGTIFEVDVSLTYLPTRKLFFGFHRDISARKQAEEALLVSEEKYKRLHESAGVGIGYYSPNGEVISFNTLAAKNMGGKPEDFTGKSIYELFPKMTGDVYMERIHKAAASDIVQEYEDKVDLPGEPMWFISAFTRILNSANQVIGIQIISTDITRLKRAEEALRESEAKHKNMIANISDVIAIMAKDGTLRYKSPNIEKWFGWQPDDLTGTDGWDTVHPDDLERIQKEFLMLLEKDGAEKTVEYRYKCKDGSYKVIHLTAVNLTNDPMINGVLMNYRDVTERKLADQALLASEEQYRRLIEILHSGVVVHAPNTEILLANQKASILLGLSLEQMQGKVANDPDWCFIREDGTRLPLDEYPVMLTIATGQPMENYVIGIDQPMGKRIWALVNTYPDFDDNHLLRQVVITFIDMTERKRAEEIIHAGQVELQRLLAETEHSSQALLSVVEDQKEAQEQVRQLNAELDQRVKERTAQLESAKQELEAFSYSVSHDLRAPLRAMDGFSAILKSDYQDKLDQQAQHYLSRIQEASRRMGQLIEDLLNLSRITRREVKLDRVDLSLLARQIAGELRSQSPERQVEFEISPDLVVRADPGLIKIALENLLNNALKYSSKKEMSLIQFGVLDQPASEGRTYFVRDNGAGFDMAYADNLFKPFQRMHGTQEFPGTGIGLTIVQRIITRHGGRIWSEASVNQGATFYFTLGTNDDPDPMGQASRQEQFDDGSRDQFR